MIQLINGDCMDILESLVKRTRGFDMIFVDPPFTEWHAGSTGKYNINKFTWYINRLLDDKGVVWLWGYIPQLLNDWEYWKRWFKCLFDMIRIKPSLYPPPTSNQYPVRAHENIWCLIKKKTKVKETKLIMKREDKPIKIKERKKHSMRDDGRRKIYKEYRTPTFIKSYHSYPSIGKHSKEYYGHPTQKPLKLVKMLIETSTREGDWILDPFAGSGTTLIAAKMMNRNAIGIEIEQKYCKIIKHRLEITESLSKLEGWI